MLCLYLNVQLVAHLPFGIFYNHSRLFQALVPTSVEARFLLYAQCRVCFCSKSKGASKPVRSSTQTKLPWMDKNTDLMGSISNNRSPSPSSTKTRNQRPDWLESSKDDPLRSSLDEMLEALDKWEPVDSE